MGVAARVDFRVGLEGGEGRLRVAEGVGRKVVGTGAGGEVVGAGVGREVVGGGRLGSRRGSRFGNGFMDMLPLSVESGLGSGGSGASEGRRYESPALSIRWREGGDERRGKKRAQIRTGRYLPVNGTSDKLNSTEVGRTR